MRLWGRKNSITVQKAMWAAAECGLSVERIDLGNEFGGTFTPWFRALNPNGRIPVLDDDGFVLWESNAIVRYLAQKHGSDDFFPRDLRRQALADQWMHWQITAVSPPLTTVFFGLIRTAPSDRDDGAIARAAAEVDDVAGILDSHLAGRPFMLGDALSMADIPLGAVVRRWYALDVPRSRHAAVEAWQHRLHQRPAFVAHCDVPLT